MLTIRPFVVSTGVRLKINTRQSGWSLKSSGSHAAPTNPDEPVSSRHSVTTGPSHLYGTNEMVSARDSKELPAWLSGAIVAGVGVCLVGMEIFRALRRERREPKVVHHARNLALASGALLVMQWVEKPFAMRLSARAERLELGLAPRLTKSRTGRLLLSVILLDYGLYVWHVLTHKVPLLWRFHLVHHVDLDLDASTAVRFHFGEMLLSVPWRLAQIRVVGASPRALSIWQTFLLVSILFHHSNVRLPVKLERFLSYIIMTPRLHSTHHELRIENTNSNWSSGLSIWDLLHGTYKWQRAQAPIGVPAFQDVADVALPRCILLPFEPETGREHSQIGFVRQVAPRPFMQ